MARIQKVVPSGQISNFRQAAPEAGGAFRFMAEVAETAYTALAPAAEQEMDARGAALGREIARQQIGDPQGAATLSTMSGVEDFNAGLARTESGGDFTVVNDLGYSGKYQVGQARLDDYNRANGTTFKTSDLVTGTPEAAALTERVQRWHVSDIDSNLGGLVGRVVQGKPVTLNGLRAAAHLGGIGGARRHVETDGAYNPADANGTRISDYIDTHGSGSVTLSTSGGPPAPTMIRDADGALTGRLFSPMSGPLLQAHNAAAGVAYQSEMLLKGQTDLLDISNQFSLNPEGYQQAARAYVDDMVKAAPEAFREDVRSGLERGMQQRFLGMVEEKQRDVRQRANNSSAALAERWSDNLAQAIASGDEGASLAARVELGSVLRARESLPGAAWTREQSENLIRKAEEQAVTLRQKAQKEQTDAWKGGLSTIVDAAKNGRTAADEAILDNPIVRALLPEESAEALAFVTLRDNMPSFLGMTPADQATALAEMKATEVQADWEVDLFNAAESAAKGNKEAWEKDPVARAAEVLRTAPPEVVPPSMENPDAFKESLAARSAYMQQVQAQGYINFGAVFSDAEAEQYKALMGADTPPELKAMIAGAIVAGAGPLAPQAFREIAADDPVTMMSGMMMARGGDPSVATAAMVGQAKLDQGLVQPPKKATSIAAVDANIATALTGVPNGVKIAGDTMQLARAIWANGAPPGGYQDEAAETEAMATAMQKALGQTTNRRGDVLGGVQEVGANPVLLPSSISGQSLDGALERAFMGDGNSLGFLEGLAAMTGYETADADTAIWTAAGAPSVPMLGGRPVSSRHFRNGLVSLTPEGGNRYRLSLNIGGNLEDARTADGAPFIFDAQALIEAAQ